MIEISTNLNIKITFIDPLRDPLKKDSSKVKLFGIIQRHFLQYGVQSDFTDSFIQSRELKLSQPDERFWMISNPERCLGLFRSHGSPTDNFVFRNLTKEPRTVDWEKYNTPHFVENAINKKKSPYYIVNENNAQRWIHIESEYPECFFRPQNDAFDRFGYIGGQRFIFEAIVDYLGEKAKPLIDDPMGVLSTGRIHPFGNLWEASGYWVISYGERGTPGFIALFCSYRDAVDFFIYYFFNIVEKNKIPWKEVFK